MAISVNPGTKVITIPQSYCTFASGVIYNLDVNQLRLDLRDWEDSEIGIVMEKTHVHKSKTILSGVTYARVFEVINGYQIEFENTGSHWTVNCTGANHNIVDVMIHDNVNIIVNNSAGLIEVAGTPTGVADEVWSHVGASAVNKEDDLKKARKAAEDSFAVSA